MTGTRVLIEDDESSNDPMDQMEEEEEEEEEENAMFEDDDEEEDGDEEEESRLASRIRLRVRDMSRQQKQKKKGKGSKKGRASRNDDEDEDGGGDGTVKVPMSFVTGSAMEDINPRPRFVRFVEGEAARNPNEGLEGSSFEPSEDEEDEDEDEGSAGSPPRTSSAFDVEDLRQRIIDCGLGDSSEEGEGPRNPRPSLAERVEQDMDSPCWWCIYGDDSYRREQEKYDKFQSIYEKFVVSLPPDQLAYMMYYAWKRLFGDKQDEKEAGAKRKRTKFVSSVSVLDDEAEESDDEDEGESKIWMPVINMTPRIFLEHILFHDHDPRIVQAEQARNLRSLLTALYNECYVNVRTFMPNGEEVVRKMPDTGKIRTYATTMKLYRDLVKDDFSMAFGASTYSTVQATKFGIGNALEMKGVIEEEERNSGRRKRKR